MKPKGVAITAAPYIFIKGEDNMDEHDIDVLYDFWDWSASDAYSEEDRKLGEEILRLIETYVKNKKGDKNGSV